MAIRLWGGVLLLGYVWLPGVAAAASTEGASDDSKQVPATRPAAVSTAPADRGVEIDRCLEVLRLSWRLKQERAADLAAANKTLGTIGDPAIGPLMAEFNRKDQTCGVAVALRNVPIRLILVNFAAPDQPVAALT